MKLFLFVFVTSGCWEMYAYFLLKWNWIENVDKAEMCSLKIKYDLRQIAQQRRTSVLNIKGNLHFANENSPFRKKEGMKKEKNDDFSKKRRLIPLFTARELTRSRRNAPATGYLRHSIVFSDAQKREKNQYKTSGNNYMEAFNGKTFSNARGTFSDAPAGELTDCNSIFLVLGPQGRFPTFSLISFKSYYFFSFS